MPQKINDMTIFLFIGIIAVLAMAFIDGDVPPTELTLFREQCIDNETVSCSWATLELYLENKTISRLWWNLTRDERYSISEMAVKNTMFYQINFKGTGQPECSGAEVFEYITRPCGTNAKIRYLKFATSEFQNIDTCYWKRSLDSEEHCYQINNSYNLPCYFASCSTYGPGYAHYLCAIQIDPNIANLDSWIFFQYSDFDIKPPHTQMPSDEYNDLHIKIHEIVSFKLCRIQRVSDIIVIDL